MRLMLGTDGLPWTNGQRTLFDGTTDTNQAAQTVYITLFARPINNVAGNSTVAVTVDGTTVASYTPAIDPTKEYKILDRVPFTGAVQVKATCGAKSMAYGYLEYDFVDACASSEATPFTIAAVPTTPYTYAPTSLTVAAQFVNVGDSSQMQCVSTYLNTKAQTVTLSFTRVAYTTTAALITAAAAAGNSMSLVFGAQSVVRLFERIPMLGCNIVAASSNNNDGVLYGTLVK